MRKIVINVDFGGFSLSHEAIMRYAEIKGISIHAVEKDSSLLPYEYYTDVTYEKCFWDSDIPRDDPALIQVIEELGEAANGRFATLHICEIPEDVNWYIAEYDGLEHVAEEHRTWR